MIKRTLVLIILVALSLTGCNEKNSDLEKEESSILSSENYSFERAFINVFKEGYNMDVKIDSWKFVDNDMIYILDTTGREFLVDRQNVTFFSVNKDGSK